MGGRNPAAEAPDSPGQGLDPLVQLGDHSPPEDQFGDGDICSPEEDPPTDDDKPLD